MKIDELKKALRNIIREEVKKVVAEEVSKAMGKVLVEMVREIKSSPKSTTINEEIEEDEVVESPINTNNPKLNSVLAETARHFKQLPRTAGASSGLVELMDGGFDKIGQNESVGVSEKPASNMDFLRQMVSQSPQPISQPSALDCGTDVPDVLKKVFKKDFRAVMKKIDEQKKNGGGGYIDPSRILTG